MNNTRTTEQQIATFARTVAKQAAKLRRAGKHCEAEMAITKARRQAEEWRAARA